MKNIFSKQKNKKAFTLIEILLYVTVLGICLGAMAGFMNMISSAQAKNKVILEVERQGENIVSIIKEEIKFSSGIISPIAGSSNIEIQLSSSDPLKDPTIIKLNNGIITIKYAAGQEIPLNGGAVLASNLEFTRFNNLNSPGSVIGSFSLSTGAGINRQEFSYQRNFSFGISRRY